MFETIKSPIYIKAAAELRLANRASEKYMVALVRYGQEGASGAHELVSAHRTLKAAHRALGSAIHRSQRQAYCGAYIACPAGALVSYNTARDMIRAGA